jgi:hypothetical protein
MKNYQKKVCGLVWKGIVTVAAEFVQSNRKASVELKRTRRMGIKENRLDKKKRMRLAPLQAGLIRNCRHVTPHYPADVAVGKYQNNKNSNQDSQCFYRVRDCWERPGHAVLRNTLTLPKVQ